LSVLFHEVGDGGQAAPTAGARARAVRDLLDGGSSFRNRFADVVISDAVAKTHVHENALLMLNIAFNIRASRGIVAGSGIYSGFA
jgi:hypothetical protein